MAGMQAVILAAGRGTRMGDLTTEIPKPMLTVHGKTLLEHKFDMLPPEIHEIILVVGYHETVIRSHFGDSYKGRRIQYVVQENLNGTGGALLCAQPLLTERFIVMMGDDLYSADDVRACVAQDDWSILVEETDHMAAGGKMIEEDGKIVAIEEGDHRGTPGLMNTNMIVLDPRLFDYPMVPKATGSDEYGLPQSVVATSILAGIPLHAVKATSWIQITAPEDLARAEELLPVEEVARA
jgi:NDP-sugar pyrophosphorylase family protein